MTLKAGDKIRGHISRNGEILYKDAPIELKLRAKHPTNETKVLHFDIFPPSRPELSVDEMCQLVIDGEEHEIQVAEVRPFAGDLYVVCFLHVSPVTTSV